MLTHTAWITTKYTKKGDKHETKENLQKETHAHAYSFSLPYSYSYCVGHNLIYKEGRQTRNNKEGLNNIKKETYTFSFLGSAQLSPPQKN